MYKYKASIIIPVYNKQEYIEECLDSVVEQTCGIENIEVVCVNDGSTDGSRDIVYRYSERYPSIRLIDQENQGVSAARNRAMSEARGKYLLFLDADDMISPNTVEDVTAFFDEHYEETDIVTYPIYYKDGKNIRKGERGREFSKNCIVDIEKYPDFAQTTMNTCVKNDKISHFDEELIIAEDQLFNTQKVLAANSIGWCSSAQYIYRQAEGGSRFSHPYYTFEDFLKFYRKLICIAKDEYIKLVYINNLFLYNLSWRIKSDWVFPYHYQGEKYTDAYNRFVEIINGIDNETILNNRWLLEEHKFYLMSLKTKNRPSAVISNHYLTLQDKTGILLAEKSVVVVFERVRLSGKKLKLIGFLKSMVFNFTGKPRLFMSIDGCEEEISLYDSACGMVASKIHTNQYWGFEVNRTIESSNRITFSVELEGKRFPTFFYFQPWNSINSETDSKYLFAKPLSLEWEEDAFLCKKFGEVRKYHRRFIRSLCFKHFNRFVLNIFAKIIKKKEIWIYNDFANVFDNSSAQFKHDLSKSDGVSRWYVYMGDRKELAKHFTFAERLRCIRFKSFLHRILFIGASKILVSFSGLGQFCPILQKSYAYYKDVIDFETIYLQHGVMHAKVDYLYAKERSPFVDRIVASTHFETKHFREKLHFQAGDVITTGMPRLNSIPARTRSMSRKILFAPSWRHYLVKMEKGLWHEVKGFEQSVFYKKTKELLQDEHFCATLRNNGLHLDIKLHPNFHMYTYLYKTFENDVISVKDSISIEDYDFLITDFSSYMFDFLYMNIPVLHFLPDDEQFRAGLHSYREFILPFDEDHPVFTEPSNLASGLAKLLENINNGKKFDGRSIFLDLPENICEAVYQSVRNQKP